MAASNKSEKDVDKKTEKPNGKGKKRKGPLFTKSERDWVLFDVGEAALSMFNTTVSPIYAASLAATAAAGAAASADIVGSWGITQTVASIIVALLMPILGSFADYKGQKIKFFIAFNLLAMVGCFAEVLPLDYVPFLIIYVFIIIGFNSMRTFYDSMLVDVTTDERMNDVSSMGFGIGYVAGVVPFVLSILFIIFGPEYLGLTKEFCTRFGFAISAIWWIIFALPLFKNYKQKYGKKRENLSSDIAKTFKGLWNTMREIAKDKRLLYFMLAYFFFIDAVFTVIAMATNYATALHIGEVEIVLALLVTQFIAFPATIISGQLANKFGAKKIILLDIFGYMAIDLFATFFLKTATDFWVLALMTGLFQGSSQAISRSLFGQIIPKKRSNEYFGFFNVFGAFARVSGTALVAFFTLLTGNPSVGVFSIMFLLVFGLAFMLLMPKTGLEGTEAIK